MRQELLHDALDLLEEDLIEEVDLLRRSKKRKGIPWKQMAPLAACLCVMLVTAAVSGNLFWKSAENGMESAYDMAGAPADSGTNGISETTKEAAAEVPAEMEESLQEAVMAEAAAGETEGTDIQESMSDMLTSESTSQASGRGDLSTEKMMQTQDGVLDFSVRLFQNSMTAGENVLISPLSVLSALAMTANGAGGETLAQMKAVLGVSTEELNLWMRDYRESLPQEKAYTLSLANSIWFRDKSDSFTVNQDFLSLNEKYYDAGIFARSFDNTTLGEINRWVKKHTDGMIPNILDQISEDAVMYLVNALAFDAEWQQVYNESQVGEGIFTTESGREQQVELMYSEEHAYLEDEKASGFVKYYKDGAYAFVALLPKEGVSVEEYVDSLTWERLQELLETPEDTQVKAAIPKFEAEYSVEMSQILKQMGMTDAFDQKKADFSGLGSSSNGNILIDQVVHKTFMAVDERGTKAGAATAVAMVQRAAMREDPKTVYLDRPFVYLLIDCENHLPVFMGTMMDVG